jgi:hypothetical protein
MSATNGKDAENGFTTPEKLEIFRTRFLEKG